MHPGSPDHLLIALAGGVRLLLEALSVLTVLLGVIDALRRRARLRYGHWLSLALEFQLGADIVATISGPTSQNLVQLAVVAVIRTLLNVFLVRDLEAERRLLEASPWP
ncbi:MAG: DUF1622 domain-containing protein [Cyanobacteriota bacterium]